jgi:DNA-binding NarL/FixJ family response regulator
MLATEQQPNLRAANGKMRMRVLVAAGSPIALGGICLALGTQTDITIVGTASNGVELLERAGALRPDFVVSEVSIPRVNELKCALWLGRVMPVVQIILVADSDSLVTLDECLESGASSCIRKDQLPEGLVSEVRSLFLAR